MLAGQAALGQQQHALAQVMRSWHTATVFCCLPLQYLHLGLTAVCAACALQVEGPVRAGQATGLAATLGQLQQQEQQQLEMQELYGVAQV